MSQKITIKQIAEMAGVSVASVSFVLNGKKGVSEETRKRISEIISHTNYMPNVNSQRLILQRSFNILLAIDPNESPLNNFFYADIMNSIVETGAKLGYNIVLTTISSSFKSSMLETILLRHDADGIIFLCDISHDLQENIEKVGTPYVVVDSQKKIPPYPSVHADYMQSSYCAVRYLLENGHTKIAMIGANCVPDYFACNFEGYKKALTEFGISIEEGWVCTEAVDETTTQKSIKELMKENNPPTAAFCTSDLVAISTMNCLQEEGYILPDDFSVCSIDDIALARYHYPPLTTIQIDKNAMGKYAVEMLDKLINGVDTDTNLTVSSDNLIIRNSVKQIF